MSKTVKVSKEYINNGDTYRLFDKGKMLEGKRWIDCAIVKSYREGIYYVMPIELFNTKFNRKP